MNVIDQAEGQGWVLYTGDAVEVLRGIPDHSVHLGITSPPFTSIYTYSPSDRDLGNVRSSAEFFAQFAFITDELRRVLVPGRVMAVHCQDIQLYGTKDGRRARADFPGDLVRHFEAHGFDYRARVTINKNPQAAAIRNHPQELLFMTLRKDAAKSFPAQADYVLLFTAPGDNPVPIAAPISENDWIRDAAPVWMDIRETDVLPVSAARDTDDERHLCPLQLPVIERCVRLWSNPGEVVLDPFMGVGSTGVGALRQGRKALGMELKPAYARVAARNLRDAEQVQPSRDLFALAGVSP